MLNKIWPFFIIFSFIYAIYSGNIFNINNAIFESAEQTVNLCLTMFGTICLWNGIMKIAVKTSLISIITVLSNFFYRFPTGFMILVFSGIFQIMVPASRECQIREP